jgi:predicted transcriptional regulator
MKCLFAFIRSIIKTKIKIMPKGKHLTEHERGLIDGLRLAKKSYREIAELIGRSHTAVSTYLNRKENYCKNRTGRPSILSEREKRRIRNYSSNKIISLPQIKTDLQCKASVTTIWRTLDSCPYIKNEKIKCKPPLKDSHKIQRLNWAQERMSWTEQWQGVIFSDEKKFNLDGPDGYKYYWHDLRKDKKVFSKRNHGGGSVMVWAAFAFNGKTNIAFIDHRMKSKDYINLLNMHLMPFAAKIGGLNWVFQQDNAPIHTSAESKEWFKAKNIKVMNWPSISPDLNPIENLWGLLVHKVYANGRQFNNIKDLIQAINECWEDISIDVLRKYINSMPNRVFQLILKNGASIDY